MTRAGCFAAIEWRYCVAVSAIALSFGISRPAQAALYYWTDGGPGFYRPLPKYPHSQKAKHGQAQKKGKPEKEAAKPQGPLIVAISINQQKLKLYDANGVYAESPVSTGMSGHPTPMGVFSIIQKQKYHRSNIYSGAPMPYMQRITWSGVAMHAGVLPGYPASHGCIRMPMAFAVKMWNWTRMGARVVVTPGEMMPSRLSHPLLPAFKVAPVAAQADTNDPLGAKADKGAQGKAVSSEAQLDLRATIGHRGNETAGDDVLAGDRMQTADASRETPSSRTTMSDASPGMAAGRPEDTTGAKPEAGKSAESKSTESAPTQPSTSDPKAASGTQAAAGSGDQPADVDAKKGEPAAPPTTKTETKPIEAGKAVDTSKPADAGKDQTRPPDAAKREAPKRSGQIAVFISRKDSKLYVRQNFEPLFDAPVMIAASERPLGTHVFTAEVDRTDANVLRWSVVSLPVAVRTAMRSDGDERRTHHRKSSAGEAKPALVPDSASEALDRITIPADAMTRVAEALTSGGSIIVSDQGINQGETGEGTDFIVSLR